MTVLRISTLAALVMGLTGCAYDSEIVAFSYVVPPPPDRTIASAAALEIAVADLRPLQDRISSKTDAYGYEHAPISTTEPVATIVRNALSGELVARGYRLGASGASIEVVVKRFYTRFQDHHYDPFKQDTADARVELDVTVKNGRAISFSRTVSAFESIRAPTQLHWGGTAVESLSSALRKAIETLADDPKFRNALGQRTVWNGGAGRPRRNVADASARS